MFHLIPDSQLAGLSVFGVVFFYVLLPALLDWAERHLNFCSEMAQQDAQKRWEKKLAAMMLWVAWTMSTLRYGYRLLFR